ncbi:MAG: MBL fold metallo-hydrolase [Oscillospiraceae bacterium]
MKIEKIMTGILANNCYILTSEKNNCIIVDPGGETEKLKEMTKDCNDRIVLLTHGHVDHIAGCYGLSDTVYVHEDDLELLTDNEKNMANALRIKCQPIENAKTFKDGDLITLDDITLRVMHTPGHTKGSCCFVGDTFMLTGDTVFLGTYGRTDHYGGSYDEIQKSLKKVLSLNKDYLLYCGHGGNSRLFEEKQRYAL